MLDPDERPLHRLLGYADPFDSDPERNMLFGDLGVVSFMIRGDDLRAGRFERAWVESQCH